MRKESVDILSDLANAAVIRHPGRKFPGVFVQGDTLFGLCRKADAACASARGSMPGDDFAELNDLRNHLWELLNHYKRVLEEHSIGPPFSDVPDV